MRIFIPSYYGDVSLEQSSETLKSTVLKVTNLSADELVIVKAILKKFRVKEPEGAWPKTIEIPADLPKVHAVLVKNLKKHKPTITAVKLAGGKLEEVQSMKNLVSASDPEREAVTVTPPVRGCPMPIFDAMKEAAIRATEVLYRFIGPNQRRDFERHHSFVTIGGATGTRYQVSHRDSRVAAEKGLAYNLDKKFSICVHETELPAPEECLALHVVLSCPTTEEEWAGRSRLALAL